MPTTPFRPLSPVQQELLVTSALRHQNANGYAHGLASLVEGSKSAEAAQAAAYKLNVQVGQKNFDKRMSSTYWPIPPTPPCCMPRFCTSRSIHEDFWTQQYYHPDERVDIHRRRERQDMVVDYAMAVHEAKIYRRLRGTSLTEGRSSPVASIRHRTDNLAACRIQTAWRGWRARRKLSELKKTQPGRFKAARQAGAAMSKNARLAAAASRPPRTTTPSTRRGHTTGMMEDERRVHATSSASNTGFAHRPSVSTVRALAATVPSPECDEYDEREEEPCTGGFFRRAGSLLGSLASKPEVRVVAGVAVAVAAGLWLGRRRR